MLKYLSGITGQVIVNGVTYSDITAAIRDLRDYNGQIVVDIQSAPISPKNAPKAITENPAEQIFKVKVRQYMTKPASTEFDFHTKWNNGIPMPLRIMVGRKIKETPGMVKMELWGQITEEITTHCMKCGRILSNPVSRYFGIGPECGAHDYSNPFETEEELKQAVAKVQEDLRNIKWTGWIIKSAIEEETLLTNQ